MTTKIVLLVKEASFGLYLICLLGLLLSSRLYLASRRQLRVAEFELERELARRKEASAVTRTFGLIEVLLAIFAISNVVAPSLVAEPLNPSTSPLVVQPTDAPFYTSTPGGNGSLLGANGTPGGAASGLDSIQNMMLTVTAQSLQDPNSQLKILITPTNVPTLVGTINPDAPKAIGCESPEAQLQIPANGQVIFDSVSVIGTAYTANFAQYKFELSGPSTGNSFAPVGGKSSPAPQRGVLGQLSLNSFQPGSYQFRLTVFDSTQTMKASCTVNVTLSVRPPTPTLAGGK